jgi:Immunoglobulin domain/Putative adhesin
MLKQSTMPRAYLSRISGIAKRHLARGATCLLLSIALAACGGGGGGNNNGSQGSSTGATTPSIATQPTNQTVTVGQTATFSVTANGTAPLSYQWQKGGVAISGATSASYTTPAVQASDNGTTFTVTVTNAAGSVSSSAATLTVTAAAVIPPTTLSCDHFPKTVTVSVNGTLQNYTQVCLIVQELAQVTPALSVSANIGNMFGHGDSADTLSMFVVYGRVVVTAADEGTATALAKSVVINTANGSVSSTPDHLDEPQFLGVDFEAFTNPSTNLTLTSNVGNQSVDNFNATLKLMASSGNVILRAVQGQVTANTHAGNIDAALSGSSWTGAGMSATTQSGNITVARPAGYQAAFTAKSDVGNASIDSQKANTADPTKPAIVTAGSGAPINLESKSGDVSVIPAK